MRVNANNFDANTPIPVSIRCADFYIDANPSNRLLKISGDTGDATFSGSVSAGQSKVWDAGIYRRNMNGLAFNGVGVLPCNGSGQTGVGNADGVYDLGLSNDRFKNGYFSGTVDAAGFTVNGQPISGGGGGLPDGGYTYGWTITATDFIASSDERLKDNIITAPVGLIDSLKGREWDWKESGEKGSGVVAQELEQVLPHLVHTDDDGMKSVAMNGLIAYLIEELKDCRQRLAVLEAKD